MTLRRRFLAMGTTIELLVDAERADRPLAAAEGEFHRLERVLTRFRDDSELSRLNHDGAIDAGPDLVRVIALALDARDRTDGRFDPTVHDALLAAGYDRTFAELTDGDLGEPRPGGGGVHLDGSRIVLDEGVRVDLGGIGKGYAAERAAEILAVAGPALVNAGGDIAVRGGAWPIGVEDVTLELSSGGLATSGRDRRRWSRGGREQHHLIDPRTGAPARTELLRVTVVADDAVEAEVQAKNVFLGGRPEGCAYVLAVSA
ncbi:MAG TPA: FAD:protein FMN transferase [Gaiellaceae bacterium]|nr:FAD:protein FMN transferase [Gaiellaceae bacterium]